MSTLTLTHLSREFGGLQAVADVSLEALAGRITGVIGPNGAGKTTLINLITGILKPSQGQIAVSGTDITTLEAPAIAQLGVARTFQTIRLLKEVSVLDNVVAGYHRHEKTSRLANLLWLPSARRELAGFQMQAMELLQRFGMSGLANRRAGELSYGHQRRVEMMRALAMNPQVILLDEPVAGMNDVEALELGRIFRAMADQGKAVLLIEHNMRFVMSLCEFIYVLESGRLIAKGTPAQVSCDPEVIRAYLGSDDAIDEAEAIGA